MESGLMNKRETYFDHSDVPEPLRVWREKQKLRKLKAKKESK